MRSYSELTPVLHLGVASYSVSQILKEKRDSEGECVWAGEGYTNLDCPPFRSAFLPRDTAPPQLEAAVRLPSLTSSLDLLACSLSGCITGSAS